MPSLLRIVGFLLAVLLIVVALGQLLGYGLGAGSSPWRLVPSMVIAGVATGLLNALLGREAVASVGADRAAMGSGANNTARYLGAAVGITLFVVIAVALLVSWIVAVLFTPLLGVTMPTSILLRADEVIE